MRHNLLFKTLTLLFFFILPFLSHAKETLYNIDAVHSSIRFTVSHLLGEVYGRFNRFSGQFNFDEALKIGTNLKVVINPTSIDTGHQKRDDQLKSSDFFDTGKFPEIKFSSTKIEPIMNEKFRVQGILFLHGITKPVVLTVNYMGQTTNEKNETVKVFKAETKINRHEFGLDWNKTIANKQLLIGEEVKIDFLIEAIKAPSAKSPN